MPPQDEEDNPWITRSSKQEYDNNWLSVTEHQVVRPDGKNGIYGVVHIKSIAIGILPIDDEGYTWLIGQYRYALSRYSWEIPEGNQ